MKWSSTRQICGTHDNGVVYLIVFNMCIDLNPYKPSVLLVGHKNNADPDQTLQNAASNQVLHCSLTERSIKILKDMKNTNNSL